MITTDAGIPLLTFGNPLSYPAYLCQNHAMKPRPIRSSPTYFVDLMCFLNSTFFYPVKCVKLFTFQTILLNKPNPPND